MFELLREDPTGRDIIRNMTSTSSLTERTSSFYSRKPIIVTGIVTASISFVSSGVILGIIFRRHDGVRVHSFSAYHRIIVFLCLADCLTSLAIALATLPMPRDLVDYFDFELPSYGTKTTCEIQGHTYLIGNCYVFWMNGMLNIYYLCKLRFNMEESKYTKYIEIPLFLLGLILIPTIGIPLNLGTMYPGRNDPYCMMNCPPDVGDCVPEKYAIEYLGVLGTAFIVLMLCMTLITVNFFRNEYKLKKFVKRCKETEEEEGELLEAVVQELIHAQQLSGIITRQAVLYVLAFISTWIFGFIEFIIVRNDFDSMASDNTRHTLAHLRMIFQPLQGFFNLLIFFYHKILAVRRNDEEISFCEAFMTVLHYPELAEDQVVVSNMNLLCGNTLYDYASELHRSRNKSSEPVERSLGDVELSSKVGASFGSAQVHSSALQLESIEEEHAHKHLSSFNLSGFSGMNDTGDEQNSPSMLELVSVAKNENGLSYASSAPHSLQEDDGISFETRNTTSKSRHLKSESYEDFNDDYELESVRCSIKK